MTKNTIAIVRRKVGARRRRKPGGQNTARPPVQNHNNARNSEWLNMTAMVVLLHSTFIFLPSYVICHELKRTKDFVSPGSF